jgi:hypothetical protein
MDGDNKPFSLFFTTDLPESPEARGEVENPGKYVTPGERISLSLQYLEP